MSEKWISVTFTLFLVSQTILKEIKIIMHVYYVKIRNNSTVALTPTPTHTVTRKRTATNTNTHTHTLHNTLKHLQIYHLFIISCLSTLLPKCNVCNIFLPDQNNFRSFWFSCKQKGKYLVYNLIG